MIHEFRIYRLHPGKLAAFKRRFEQVTMPLFAQMGIKLLGFWEMGRFRQTQPQVGAGGVFLPGEGTTFGHDQIAYLVSFESIEKRDAAWRAWMQEPRWLDAKRRSEADGPLVAEESCFLLAPTTFSP